MAVSRLLFAVLVGALLSTQVAAQDNDESRISNTSPVVWILLVIITVVMGIPVLLLAVIAYKQNTRLCILEQKCRRRSSVSSDHFSYKGTDSRNSSVRSGIRYERTPIRKKSPARGTPTPPPQIPPPPQQQQQEQRHSSFIYKDTISGIPPIYGNMLAKAPQDPNTTANGGTAITLGSTPPVLSKYDKISAPIPPALPQPRPVQTEAAPSPAAVDQLRLEEERVGEPTIVPYDTTVIPLANGEYCDVAKDPEEYTEVFDSTTPPAKNRISIKSGRRSTQGKRPTSADEYSEPTVNGVENMKKLHKAATISGSNASSPSVTPTNRRASDSTAPKRPDHEDWRLKSKPKQLDESDL